MDAHLITLLFPERKLAIREAAVPMLTAIQVPEVEIPARTSPNAARTKAAKGHAMPGAIIEVAGIAHRERGLPAQAKRTTPTGFWRLPTLP